MDILKKYRQIIESEFPTSFISNELGVPSKDEDVIDVFGIPDDRRSEFRGFLMTTLARFLVENDLPRCAVIPHTDTDTQKYYPQQWEAVCAKREFSVHRESLLDKDDLIAIPNQNIPDEDCDTPQDDDFALAA